MNGIRKILRFEAEPTMLRHRHAASAYQALGRPVKGPQLDTRLAGMTFHHSTLAAFESPSREAETLASMAEDKIMIVAGRRQAGVHPAGADGGGLSKVQSRAEDGQ